MSKLDWKNIVVGAIGLIGLGYGIAMHTKMGKISERLDKTIDELADNTEIDIPESLVNKAVEKAVTIKAKEAVEKATTDALAELKRDIRDAVSAAVDKEYEGIKDTVLKKATDEAAKIDTVRVRRDVEKAAYNAAMEKFNDNLGDILDKFNDNLNNVSKIYSSMASAATRTPDKEFTFKLG